MTKNERLRLLVLIPSLPGTSPGSRFRIEQWLPHLEKHGVAADVESFEDEDLHRCIYVRGHYLPKTRLVLRALGRRRRLLKRASESYHAAFVFEEVARLGPALFERWIAWQGLPILYDFCDPVWLPYSSPRNRYLSRLKFPSKTAVICRLSKHVMVGNDALAEYARQFNAHVSTIPITIDTEVYTERGWCEVPAVPIIGWSGSHSTLPHLDTIRPVLIELARKRRFTLRVVGSNDYNLPGVCVDSQPWSVATESVVLSTFDIGIMPLPADRWTTLRSNLKVRQYMGVGVPAVVSPVGVNRDLIRDGVDGYLAATKQEWLDKLTLLLDNVALREKIGRAGRRAIEDRFSARVWSLEVLKLIRTVGTGSALSASTQ